MALGDGMIQRDIYLMNAALLFAKAEAEKDSAIKADFENMARAYLRLADQAERNAHNDVVYEIFASTEGSRSTIGVTNELLRM